MKLKMQDRKISLHRETVRLLDSLSLVKGGGVFTAAGTCGSTAASCDARSGACSPQSEL